MPIRNILVHADTDGRRGVRFEAAVGLAQRHEAHLTALFALEVPEIPGYVSSQISAEALAFAREQQREAVQAIQAEFEEAASREGVRSEWRYVEGPILDTLAMHSRYADIAVVSKLDPEGGLAALAANLPGELAVNAGRPVLVVPSAGHFLRLGDTVLVAWNGSREATRALHDALPFLYQAQSVTVLVVNPRDQAHIPGADIAAHLAHHGLKVEARHSVVPDIEAGDEILNTASDLGADLVVMGAYGHSRFRELVLGGATQHLLRHATTPVLMSH